MGKREPWKIGVGAACILLGAYVTFNEISTILSVIGLLLIAAGLAVISSY